MSSNLPISSSNITAPTPQNTPLNQAPIAQGLSRPTVPDITEDKEPGEDEEVAAAISGSAGRAAMLDMVQGRLAGLVGQSSGYVENLPTEVKLSVEALKGVQVKQLDLQKEYKKECLALEKKYLELTKPLYERRNAIIHGTSPPTSEEIEAGEKESLKDDEEYTALPKDGKPQAIPEFWLTALRNHIALSELISDRDAGALKHLQDVTLEYLSEGEQKLGFKIVFHFSENEYFENKVLEKSYIYQNELGYGGEFVYEKALGTSIKWKDDKDLTKEFEIKKQRNKNTNRTRMVRKATPVDSFFNFFDPPVPPSEDAMENEEISPEELDEVEEKLEMDYQIGEDFKEKIIPRAVDYFTGKALEYDVYSEVGDSEFEDIDEDDDESDADEDSDAGKPAKRRGPAKGKSGGGGGGGANPNPEECKQQ